MRIVQNQDDLKSLYTAPNERNNIIDEPTVWRHLYGPRLIDAHQGK